jgi:hypothetical protein
VTLPKTGQVLTLECKGCKKRNRITFKLGVRYRCALCRKDFEWKEIETAATIHTMLGGNFEDVFKGFGF